MERIIQLFKSIHTVFSGHEFQAFCLKPKQVLILEQVVIYKRDVVGVLPTGYGKSLIFQLLPFVFPTIDKRNIVIVVCPLTSIILDQLSALQHLKIAGAVLYNRFVDREDYIEKLFASSNSEGADNNNDSISENIIQGNINLLFCHPEDVLSNKGRDLLRSDLYQRNVVACVIDEAHCIEKWGEDFRKDFDRLSTLKAFYPRCPILALTATAAGGTISLFSSKLSLSNPCIVKSNPDRKNIFLEKRKRSSKRGFDSYQEILEPLANDLLVQQKRYPMTIVYLKLKYCGYAYKLFERVLTDKQYGGDEKLVTNRLFAQFHAPQTKDMKRDILSEIMKENSGIRIIFATSALGMGVNIPYVEQIIHISPPSSLEEYMQQIGRGGRQNVRAKALLYFNASDISTSTHVEEPMRSYCLQQDECLRKKLLNHFGFKSVYNKVCCSYCVHTDEAEREKGVEKVRVCDSIENVQAELADIISKWNFDDENELFLTDSVNTDGLCNSILSSIDYIKDDLYLLEHFGVWNEELAEQVMKTINRHAPLLSE